MKLSLSSLRFKNDEIVIKKCEVCQKVVGCLLSGVAIRCKFCDIQGLSYCPSRWEEVKNELVVCAECEQKIPDK